ncbi:hypothetical protein WV31_19410 [Magnetospirillum sp. ME-1]|uniref:hypothetical protein n=1 Tax=Magnetospirillum sp. ME-1 TaxID=1639348 RepID=UPI000A17CB0F|nr:hypothetical protein [Magnetospirillum sp. ME-1]ARJ67667.1 hypothetical protein WV31_19410 [Magnetospirillum sp. ME-1]
MNEVGSEERAASGNLPRETAPLKATVGGFWLCQLAFFCLVFGSLLIVALRDPDPSPPINWCLEAIVGFLVFMLAQGLFRRTTNCPTLQIDASGIRVRTLLGSTELSLAEVISVTRQQGRLYPGMAQGWIEAIVTALMDIRFDIYRVRAARAPFGYVDITPYKHSASAAAIKAALRDHLPPEKCPSLWE